MEKLNVTKGVIISNSRCLSLLLSEYEVMRESCYDVKEHDKYVQLCRDRDWCARLVAEYLLENCNFFDCSSFAIDGVDFNEETRECRLT